MDNKLVWPIVAVVCASIVGAGLYLGLRNSGQRISGTPGMSGQDGEPDPAGINGPSAAVIQAASTAL